MKKSFFVGIIVLAFISCRAPNIEENGINNNLSITKTIESGGDYTIMPNLAQQVLTKKMFSISSDKLKIEGNQLATFDLFYNDTNYIWHATKLKSKKFYRFITDKNFENVKFQEVIPSEIKEELKLLNN